MIIHNCFFLQAKLMAKPKRELKSKTVTCRLTPTKEQFIINQCEARGISASEYLNILIDQSMTKEKNKKKQQQH